jgi:hypothetical protein
LPSHLHHLVVALQLPHHRLAPPFARHRHHPDRRRLSTRTGTATAIAIGVVVIVIPIGAAATTDTILSATVRVRCRCCRVGGPVGGTVIDNNAVVAVALAA